MNLSAFDFDPVVRYNREWYIFDLQQNYDPDFIREKKWGIGRYNEKRPAMYNAPQYGGCRNIHLGIDFWTPAGEPVFAFHQGEIAYFEDHDQAGNYGPTIVTKHRFNDIELFALHGHLTRESLSELKKGDLFKKGEKIAEIGTEEVNGGWIPHLHFQISFEDPKTADMPGVVAEEDREEAVKKYPDPRLVLGNIY